MPYCTLISKFRKAPHRTDNLDFGKRKFKILSSLEY